MIQCGGFSAQLRHAQHADPFARIAVDQKTEEAINKDTQTAGVTHRFGVKPGTVSCPATISQQKIEQQHCGSYKNKSDTLLALAIQTFSIHAS